MTLQADRAELRLHAFLPGSRANGPGLRAVVWFQGCTLACRGCFNPQTHGAGGGETRRVQSLIDEIADLAPDLTGITLTGGEPSQKPGALRALLAGLRPRDLSVLVFTGYRLDEIRAMAQGPAILGHIDVLIAGRYAPARRLASGLLGSANQTVHLLTARHTMAEIRAVPAAEIQIDPSGRFAVTGIAPPSGAAFAE